MLNRDLLIDRLTKAGEVGDHEQLFVLRRGLRGLSLTVLAERYREALKDDPYNPSKI